MAARRTRGQIHTHTHTKHKENSLCGGVGGELLLGEAETVPRAVVGADGPLAGDALVVLKALAHARVAVAGTLG